MRATGTLATSPAARRRNAFSVSVPRQHGAWSILLASYLVGVAALGGNVAPALVLLVAVVGGFMARHAIVSAVRMSEDDLRKRAVEGWAALYGVFGALSAAVLLTVYHRWLLVPLGALALVPALVALILEQRRQDRTLAGELVGAVGLSLIAPLASYAASGTLEGRTWALWFLTAGFFAGSVFHIRYVVRCKAARAGTLAARLHAALPSVCFHFAALVAAFALGALGLLPRLAPYALVYALARVCAAVGSRRTAPVVIRRVGFAEVGHTLAFMALLVAAYRVAQ
jgi:4-hydroxybenzoate polyprenyltransferase